MREYYFLFLFYIVLCTGCDNGSRSTVTKVSGRVQKITVLRDQVYDLSGYSFAGGGNPFNLFDENAYVDPRYDHAADAYIPVSNCQPTIHPSIFFHNQQGNRIVVDLKTNFSLKEIFLYDRSNETDSFWIYTGDMLHWKKITAMTTVSQPGDWGWKKISLEVNTRFIMIRFSSFESDISEMVLYGNPNQNIPAPTDFSLHKGFTKLPLDQFLGVNYIMEKEPRWLKPFHYSRLYNFALDYDNDSTKDEGKVRFNMLHYGYYDKEKKQYVFDIDTLQHVNQGNIWFSIRGVSMWMNDLGYTDRDRPLNRPGLESESPVNYSRHAEMMWHLAAFFGFNPIDTNLMSLSNIPRRSGRGSMDLYENGNEEDATWNGNKYCSPYEYFAQSSADWDGDEGRIGKRYGIHSADSGASLMMSGLVGLDTNRVKTYAFLSENLRNDRQFIWKGGIQYHYYANKNGKGVSPEDDSMRLRLQKTADCSYRISPGTPCILGENGYDKSPASWQSAPVIPGISASESQGILLLRSINATFFSGFDAYILYWLRDGNPENDPRVFLTSGILRTMPDGKTLVYPAWYYISTLINRLGQYQAEQVVREEGDVWIYKFRNKNQKDSIAYFIYKPTINGSKLKNYPLDLNGIGGIQVSKISFQNGSEQGIEIPVPVSKGKLILDIGEKPILILSKEEKK